MLEYEREVGEGGELDYESVELEGGSIQLRGLYHRSQAKRARPGPTARERSGVLPESRAVILLGFAVSALSDLHLPQ